MTQHSGGSAPDSPPTDPVTQVSLRGPAELADALPYLLGFHPDDSVVLVAVHGEESRFGGRIRLGIPAEAGEWEEVARHLARCLSDGSQVRGARPEGAVLYLCRDPAEGETARAVAERLRPLAQALRRACGEREMPVYEALCLSGGRYFSYCCPDPACCPPEGASLERAGTSPMAAAAVYAGIRVRGSLKDMEARIAPLGPVLAEAQERALDTAAAELVPRMFAAEGATAVRARTVVLARRLIARFRAAVPGPDAVAAAQDAADDALLRPEEAATLILGLQDRGTRDQAAEWMEGRDAQPALRLWRALARRCTGPYAEHAPAPLTLAGWVAWSTGDQPAARVAFVRALETDPDYVFAQLLHRACNDGLDPEPLRRCMREERAARRRRSHRGRKGGPARRGGRRARADRKVRAGSRARAERSAGHR
ncbi:DUF4192 domain-containing protein [Streptomyces sp. DSM 42041]|uniref:DUF4192 domain-containing protein n=1 Tax=Streptomyces hazeniae TaxID=3075538 RepID=A0ABU2NNS0_9ACTN|nr:DUF4192 domain-containing protein [Streptomyces sp. DSM 42041]MDT0378394.1 DUF4192 domain-containing protein [Streptomyces sp. DSM 42041]